MSAKTIIKALKSFATKECKTSNERFFKTREGQYSQFDEFVERFFYILELITELEKIKE